MANSNQRTGKVFLFVDGSYCESDGGAKISGFAPKREAVIGDQVHGYKETPVAGQIDCTFIHGNNGISLAAMATVTNSSITFQTDSGAIYVLNNAWASEVKELDGKEGKFAVTFLSATPPQETLAS